MDETANDLWSLEKSRWLDGAKYYERRLGPDAAMVIPYPDGLQDRTAALEGRRPARQWHAIELHDQNLRREGETVMLSYRIVAWRDCCSTPMSALCASTYLDDDGTWLRLSHDRQPVTPRGGTGRATSAPFHSETAPLLGAA
ncbi:hypothetical protein [Limimaricola pyoseonensis]|uniref:DUF4440 domain-containing protein n=1 Tax=Limimaricola pyoseonensis TaxID=521013 RepID=A0A1G6ZX40_9RHOB|nr:hypothetical protein [Limimaricola pyoseonensis]SDE06206.1 hypothetical protein SAMN04488567_0681 [Limimaricola pyoseonensis]